MRGFSLTSDLCVHMIGAAVAAELQDIQLQRKAPSFRNMLHSDAVSM